MESPDPAQHERRQERPGLGRRRTQSALCEERHERDGAEHRHARQEPNRDRHRDNPVTEQPERHDRVFRPPLDVEEDRRQHRGARHQREVARRGELPERRPALDQTEHQKRDGRHQQRRARVVDGGARRPLRLLERELHDDGGENAEGHVDVEDPAPRELVGDEPADDRPDHARNPPHAAEERLHPRALLDRVDVADDCHPERHERARAESLHRAEDDELRHRRCHPREHRADEEDRDAELEEETSAVEVGELAPDRHGDGRGDEVGREDPAVMAQAAERGDDRRHRRADHGRFERGQEHPRDDAERHRQTPP